MRYGELEDLTREHEAFLGFLSAWERDFPPRRELEEFHVLLEEVHHGKEERFLFPLLADSLSLEVGGPMCMTFFTPRVLGGMGWTDSFADLRSSLGYAGPAPGELTPFRETAFRQGSMIRIPLEDHILGARAMAELRSAPAGAEPQRARFARFAAFLKDHIRREEECLFMLLKRELSPEQKNLYAEQASAFDREQGTAELLSRLRSLIPKP